MILRIEAARSRLAAHHSAPFGGMRGGGSGRGNGGRGGVDLHAARQLFFSLFGDSQQVGGSGGAGGGSGGGGPRRGGGGGRLREGEWACRCGFPNRGYRERCFACGRARAAGVDQRTTDGKGTSTAVRSKGAGGGLGGKGKWSMAGEAHRWGSGGPVGANGSRPLLGAYGAKASKGPMGDTGIKGGPAKANGAAAGKSGGGVGKGPAMGSPTDADSRHGGGEDGARATTQDDRATIAAPKGAWAKPSPIVDNEGYTLVQPRRTWRDAAKGEGGREENTSGKGAGQPQGNRPRWADVDEASEDEAYADEDLEAEDQRQDGGGDEEGDSMEPGRLRARYESLARAVRDMEKRSPGGKGDDPAIVTLKEARDAAEGAWRQAKNPAPLATRMGRAQAKLDRAGAALTKARIAVDEFDVWVDNHRKELIRQKDDADAWYRWRQQQLEDLHREASGKIKCGGDGGGEDTTGSAVVSGRLIGDLLPKVHALMEYVQGNPEIEERLAGIAEGLQCAGRDLEATRKGTPEHYDIGNGDAWNQGGNQEGSGHGWGSDGDECMGTTSYDCEGEKGGKAVWRPEGEGRWSRAKVGQGMRAGAATETRDAEGPRDDGGKPGAEATQCAKGAGRQRTEAELREEADKRRAEELLQQQRQAIAAQQASHDAGAGGFGSETAQTVAAQQFIVEVCRTVERALRKGVEPRAEGKELVELTPMELRQWAAEKLGDEFDWENDY